MLGNIFEVFVFCASNWVAQMATLGPMVVQFQPPYYPKDDLIRGLIWVQIHVITNRKGNIICGYHGYLLASEAIGDAYFKGVSQRTKPDETICKQKDK